MILPKELEELKKYRQWVAYKLEPRPTKADLNHKAKVPYNVRTGYRASASDPGTWASYEEVEAAVAGGGYDGIGFELGSLGYCGIDIDNCIVDGKPTEAAQHIIDRLDSYTELSISGKGIHIWAKSVALPKTGYADPNKKNSNIKELEVYRPKEKIGGKFLGEVDGGRFLTISGDIYGEPKPIKDRTSIIKAIVKYYWPEPVKVQRAASTLPVVSDDGQGKLLQAALDSIPVADLGFNEWSKCVAALKYLGYSALEIESWSAASGNPKHISGTIEKRWDYWKLPGGDPDGAAGVIISIAKQYSFNPSTAFTADERREYAEAVNRVAPEKDFEEIVEPELNPREIFLKAIPDVSLDNHYCSEYLEFLKENSLVDIDFNNYVDELKERDLDLNNITVGNYFDSIIPQEEAAEPVEPKPYNVLDYIKGGSFNRDKDFFSKHKNRKTGFSNMDERQSLYPGLYVLGAISSLGKTTFALQMADYLASEGIEGKETAADEVLYFSLEQNTLELVSKSLSRQMFLAYGSDDDNLDKERRGFSAIEIRRGLADGRPELVEQTSLYLKNIGDRLSIISGNFSVTVEDIEEQIKKYIEINNVRPVVFIDYLQIIAPTTDKAGRPLDTKTNIDHVVHTLKSIQSRYNLVIIAICSLNRQNYLTQIDFESFKESGGIEYTADVVWGLQLQVMHKELFNKDSKINEKREAVRRAKNEEPRQIELVCLKNRYGRANYTCGFSYYPKYDTYEAQTDFEESLLSASYAPIPKAADNGGLEVTTGKRERERQRLHDAYMQASKYTATVTLYDLAEILDVKQSTVKNLIKEYGGYSISGAGSIEFSGDIESPVIEQKEFIKMPGTDVFDF